MDQQNQHDSMEMKLMYVGADLEAGNQVAQSNGQDGNAIEDVSMSPSGAAGHDESGGDNIGRRRKLKMRTSPATRLNDYLDEYHRNRNFCREYIPVMIMGTILTVLLVAGGVALAIHFEGTR